MPNFTRRTDRTHSSEFPEVSIDVEAAALMGNGFVDESWHNDAGPRFVKRIRSGRMAGFFITICCVEGSELEVNEPRERVWYVFKNVDADDTLGDPILDTDEFSQVIAWYHDNCRSHPDRDRQIEWANQRQHHESHIRLLSALGFFETTESTDKYLNMAKPLVQGRSQVVVQFLEPHLDQSLLVQVWEVNRMEATVTVACDSIGKVLEKVALLINCARS